MNIVILGAGGFIGSHLVEHLVHRGEHRVVGVDVTDDKLTGITGANFTFCRLDIRDSSDTLENLIRFTDVVVGLVAYANPSLYVSTPLEVFNLNFMQNLRVAELCAKHGKRLIQYSSAEVYGKADGGESYSEDETDLVMGPLCKHRWIYAASKSLLERVLHAHGLTGNLTYTIIRPFNFIGSRLDYLVDPGTMGGPRVFAHFMSALLSRGPMYLVNGGHVHRAFLHINDANQGLQAILDHPKEAHNTVFNLGNPTNNLTIRQLALLMMELYTELTGKTSGSAIVEVTGEEFYGAGYEDADRLPPDIRKLSALGWKPKYDLRSTFRDTMASYVL